MPSLDINSIIQKHKKDAEWVGLKWISEKTTHRTIKNDLPEQNHTTYDQGIRVEVLVDGHFGYAGTCDISSAGIAKAFEKAVAQTKLWSKFKIHSFTTEQRPKTNGHYRSQIQKPLDSLSTQEIKAVLS